MTDSTRSMADLRTTVGPASLGVELRVVEPDSTDAAAVGRRDAAASCRCAGPWIAAAYYNDDRVRRVVHRRRLAEDRRRRHDRRDGYIRLVDRTKDLIKSGGEWISSVEIENELMAHPKIAEAAVIGVPHPRVVRAAAGVRRREAGART